MLYLRHICQSAGLYHTLGIGEQSSDSFFCHRHGLSTVIAKTPDNLMYRRSKHWNLEITDTRRFLWVFFGWEWCFCAKNLGLRLPYETRKTKTTWRSNRNIQDTDWKRTCQLQQIL